MPRAEEISMVTLVKGEEKTRVHPVDAEIYISRGWSVESAPTRADMNLTPNKPTKTKVKKGNAAATPGTATIGGVGGEGDDGDDSDQDGEEKKDGDGKAGDDASSGSQSGQGSARPSGSQSRSGTTRR